MDLVVTSFCQLRFFVLFIFFPELFDELVCFFPSLQSFFESHPAPAAERTVQQCCENILLNAAWLKRDADDIHQYLLQRKVPPV